MGVSDVVGARLRDLRKLKRLSVEDLAARCKEVGSPELTTAAIYAIENGRKKDGARTRHVTVDELLALASALEVTPLGLLMPNDPEDQLLVSGHAVGGDRVFDWLGGGFDSPFGDAPVAEGQYPAGLPEWLLERLREQDAESEADREKRLATLNDLQERSAVLIAEIEAHSLTLEQKTAEADAALAQVTDLHKRQVAELAELQQKSAMLDAQILITGPTDSDEFKEHVMEMAREALAAVIQERRVGE